MKGMKVVEVPASITCFFTPERGGDACKTGSYGVGIALKSGARAEFKPSDSPSDSFRIEFECCAVETVEASIEILRSTGCVKPGTLKLKPNYPVGCGFGMSAALTLSALLSISDLPVLKVADIAHRAEIESSTGLGDVVTQLYGGVVCRLNAACPSRAIIKKLNLLDELEVLILGRLDTEEALKEYDFSSGVRHLKEFLRKPTVENLFHHSKAFAEESGVIEEVKDIIEAVESAGGLASMVMLGKAVFAVNGFSALKEFGEPLRVKVDKRGLILTGT